LKNVQLLPIVIKTKWKLKRMQQQLMKRLHSGINTAFWVAINTKFFFECGFMDGKLLFTFKNIKQTLQATIKQLVEFQTERVLRLWFSYNRQILNECEKWNQLVKMHRKLQNN